jgi:hypothetical protein
MLARLPTVLATAYRCLDCGDVTYRWRVVDGA